MTPSPESRELDEARARLEGDAADSDHRRIKDSITALNRVSEVFAARRMDRAISGALAGRKIDDPALAPGKATRP